MTEKEIIDAIKYMQKYQTETDKLQHYVLLLLSLKLDQNF